MLQWELYIEMLTRITCRPLPSDHGDEATALESIHTLFGLTRETIKASWAVLFGVRQALDTYPQSEDSTVHHKMAQAYA